MTGPVIYSVIVEGDTITVDGVAIVCWANVEDQPEEVAHALAEAGYVGRRAPDGGWNAIRTVDVLNGAIAATVLAAIASAGGPVSAAVATAVGNIDFAAIVHAHELGVA